MYSWVLLFNPFLRIFVLTDTLRLLMFKVIRVELISTMFVNCFLFVAFTLCSFFFFFFCLPLYSCLLRFYLNILHYFIFSHFLVCGLCLFHFSLLVAPQFAIMNLSPLLYHPVSLHKVKVKSLSRVRHLATPWTVAYQASPSMGFSRQEYWSGLPFPFPRGSSRPRD